MNKRIVYGFISEALKGVSRLMDYWPWAVIAFLFLSAEGPHLRWSYEYRSVSGYRVYTSCSYLGSRGLVALPLGAGCPLIAWLDAEALK